MSNVECRRPGSEWTGSGQGTGVGLVPWEVACQKAPSLCSMPGVGETIHPAMPPVLQACRLTKSYGAIRAVDGVSFSVEPGEIYGLLGPNGAGKTTTL